MIVQKFQVPVQKSKNWSSNFHLPENESSNLDFSIDQFGWLNFRLAENGPSNLDFEWSWSFHFDFQKMDPIYPMCPISLCWLSINMANQSDSVVEILRWPMWRHRRGKPAAIADWTGVVDVCKLDRLRWPEQRAALEGGDGGTVSGRWHSAPSTPHLRRNSS